MYLRLTLAFAMLAPPTEEAAQAAYSAGDLAGALQMYLELAEAPGAHPPRALDGAHASLRALHRKEREVAYLCRARNLARALLKRDVFASDQERASWVELEAEDTRDLNQLGAPCPTRQPDDVSSTDEVPRAEAEPADKPQAAPIKGAPLRNPREIKPDTSGPRPGAKDSPLPRPLAQIVSGSILAAVGVGLLGGMAGALARRAQANNRIADLTAHAYAEGRPLTTGELGDAAELNHLYERRGTVAMALGIAGGVSLLTGLAVSLAPPRAASRARVRASGVGLVYSF